MSELAESNRHIKLHFLPAIIGQLEGDVLLVKGKAIAHTQAVGIWRAREGELNNRAP